MGKNKLKVNTAKLVYCIVAKHILKQKSKSKQQSVGQSFDILKTPNFQILIKNCEKHSRTYGLDLKH